MEILITVFKDRKVLQRAEENSVCLSTMDGTGHAAGRRCSGGVKVTAAREGQ